MLHGVGYIKIISAVYHILMSLYVHEYVCIDLQMYTGNNFERHPQEYNLPPFRHVLLLVTN